MMLKKILFTLVIYIYIFNPVLSLLPSIDLCTFLYPFIFFLTDRNYQHGFRKTKQLLSAWSVCVLFCLLRTLFGGEISYIIVFASILIESIFLNYVLAIYAIRNNIDLIEIALIAGTTAALISCLCLFSPAFDSFVRATQIEYSNVNTFKVFRAFGFAQSLNFEYGIVQGLICGMGVLYIKEYKWYVLFIPFTILAILINARTGLLVLAMVFAVKVIVERKIRIMVITCIMAVVVVTYYPLLSVFMPEDTYEWVEEFFLEVGDSLFGTNNSAYSSYETYNEMIHLPSGIFEWIAGSGFSANDMQNKASDIGYVNQLLYGGLLFMIALFIFCYQFIKLNINNKYVKKGLLLFMALGLLLANFKGGALCSNGGSFRLFAIISFYYFYYSHSFLTKNKKPSFNENEIVVRGRTVSY